MKDPTEKTDIPALERRAEQLEKELAQYQETRSVEHESNAQAQQKSENTNLAVKLSSEFIAAVITGGLLGFGFDYFFNTKPWALVIFLLLGFCAAIVNILRVVGKIGPSGFDKI